MKNILLIVLTIVSIISGSTIVAHSDLNDGLVAYYPFNGNANDESGNGHNGTVYGATPIMRNSNQAYQIIDSQYISLDYTVFNGLQNFSIGCWVKLNTINTTATGSYYPLNLIIGSANVNNDNEFNLFYDATNSAFGINWKTKTLGESHFDINNSVEDHNWHFISFIRTGTLCTLYIRHYIDF